MKLRVHAQLDYDDVKSIQDAYYLVGQLIGMKVMSKFGGEYEMEYGMDMVVFRSTQGSVVLSVSSGGARANVQVGDSVKTFEFDKNESLDNIAENIFQNWKAMLPVEQVA